MKVTAIMATCGRHLCAERSLSFFLRQTYENRHLLIFQNSEVHQELEESIDKSLVTLVNNHIDRTTGQPYTNLGAIYNDSLDFIPADTDVVTFWDDDDLFLDTHIEEGVKGFHKGNKTAYKPACSFYRSDMNSITRVNNTLEPSIFVKAEHLLKYGFANCTTDQHLQWLDPLIQSETIYVDPMGKPTLIYNWGDPASMYKTSGDMHNSQNFNNYRRMSKQHGDGVISPIDIDKFYESIITIIAKQS